MGYFDLVPLKIIACGVYALTSNRYINFNEDDLNRMCAAFNELEPPRPAPVVMWHPEDDAPSYGVVDLLRVVDKTIIGYAENLSDSFRRALRDGGFQRYVAQFYAPENPGNPVPGSWFLKHVGFRGKVPEIVRGFFNTDAQYMESLEGAGRAVPPELRVGKRGHVEFSEFGVIPLTGKEIVTRAQALILESSARGRQISLEEAVNAVRFGAADRVLR